MGLASTIIAALALALSVYVFLRQSALQRRMAAIEEARRRDELQPRLEANHVQRPGMAEGVEFVNTGPQDLDEVSFEIVPGGEESAPLNYLRVEGMLDKRGDLGAMPMGRRCFLPAFRGPSSFPGNEAVFRMRATAGPLRWDWLIKCKIPKAPPR